MSRAAAWCCCGLPNGVVDGVCYESGSLPSTIACCFVECERSIGFIRSAESLPFDGISRSRASLKKFVLIFSIFRASIMYTDITTSSSC